MPPSLIPGDPGAVSWVGTCDQAIFPFVWKMRGKGCLIHSLHVLPVHSSESGLLSDWSKNKRSFGALPRLASYTDIYRGLSWVRASQTSAELSGKKRRPITAPVCFHLPEVSKVKSQIAGYFNPVFNVGGRKT